MKVLSLFDGISCGMVALERAGISVERYVAYEIEPNAIKISKKNYPQIEQCGDVTTADFTQYEGIDLLIGGSPCQDLSIYKTSSKEGWNGLEGSKSNLFFHFVRALKESKPKYFLLENVASMEQKWVDVISEEMGVEPIMINSSLLCAAERKRLYWTNIPGVTLPKDTGIILKDIVIPSDQVPEKYWYDRPFTYNGDDKKVQCTLHGKGWQRQMQEVYNINGKCNTVLCDGGGGHRQKKIYQDGRCRKLMPIEYERLQTLPDNYTEGVADSHRYTAVGNGWTVDVIAHIFTGIKTERSNKEMELRVNEVQFPEALSFNYEELKQELQEKVSMYETLVYTEEQVRDAKADRAALNKLKKALNDERIRREKEWMMPFNDFKAKINEIIGIIDKPVLLIDKQVKEYEEKQKQEKADKIAQYWDGVSAPEWMDLDRIFNEKWLNASASMKSIQDEINSRLEQVEKGLATLADLPEFGFEAAEVYKTTLDLNKAISEAKRMAEIAKAKAEREAEQARLAAEAEAKKQEREIVNAPDGGTYIQDEDKQGFTYHEPEPQEPQKEWVIFKCLLAVEDAQALGQFFRSRGIAFEQVDYKEGE